MSFREVINIAEIVLPFLRNIRKEKEKVEVVKNHELFHYFNLVQRQKIYCMDQNNQKIFGRIMRDYVPAFRSLLGESKQVVLSHEYWEEFMKSRQKLIPMDKAIEEEFFHLEKIIFQCLKDEVFQEKYEFIYFVFSLYLFYLKIVVDIEGRLVCEVKSKNEKKKEYREKKKTSHQWHEKY
ncbi:MAG: hypothetical protein WBG30_02725 [Psychrilyobacter sp.]|uniref:hypothetical protein n=1 Tax=Psychrilyobacter sp. TaxID=2586924 RepID=UPI003C714389